MEDDDNRYQQVPQQDTRFLLQRVDPTDSNDRLIHLWLGEMYDKDSKRWVRMGKPVIHCEKFAMAVAAIVFPLNNREIRLGRLDKLTIKEHTRDMCDRLADMIFLRGDQNAQKQFRREDGKGFRWDYVDEEGNPKNIEVNGEMVPNPKFKGHVWAVPSENQQPLLVQAGSYTMGNLTRAEDGWEANNIGKMVQIQQTEQIIQREKEGGLFSRFGRK